MFAAALGSVEGLVVVGLALVAGVVWCIDKIRKHAASGGKDP